MAGLGTWLAPHTRSRRMGMPLPFVVNATFTPRVLTRAPFSPRPARAKGDLETNRFDPEGGSFCRRRWVKGLGAGEERKP